MQPGSGAFYILDSFVPLVLQGEKYMNSSVGLNILSIRPMSLYFFLLDH